MFKSLTEKYEFVKQFDPLAAEIYLDRCEGLLTIGEIVKYRQIDKNTVKEKYAIAKFILKNKNEAWLVGLSCRARRALIQSKYNDFNALYDDIRNEKVDLESLSKIGHKVALEIRRWCIRRMKSIQSMATYTD